MDTTKFKVEYPRECANCNGHEESVCCGALIINHDICSDCGEHTDCQCVECEYKQDEIVCNHSPKSLGRMIQCELCGEILSSF